MLPLPKKGINQNETVAHFSGIRHHLNMYIYHYLSIRLEDHRAIAMKDKLSAFHGVTEFLEYCALCIALH